MKEGIFEDCRCKDAHCEARYTRIELSTPRIEEVKGLPILNEHPVKIQINRNERFMMIKDKEGVIFDGKKVQESINNCPKRKSGFAKWK